MLSANQKKAIIDKFKKEEGDTGSPEVQIALINARINYLTEHFKEHSKDFHSKQGLFKLVGKQRTLLQYLHNSDIDRYRKLIQKLGLRDRLAVRPR